MPLLRYRVGDLAQRDGENYQVHGRIRDALRRSDERRVTTLEVDRCFEDISGIAHYQLRQSENGACDLQFISDAVPVAAGDLNRLTARLGKLLGLKNEIRAAAVDKLPPQTSGKFRLTSRVEA
jgi:acyl-coenzyme A synthetase/AMP-(fatty) acid ligase